MIAMLRQFIVDAHLEDSSRHGQMLEFIKDQFQAETMLDVIIFEDDTYEVRGKQARTALPVDLVTYLHS